MHCALYEGNPWREAQGEVVHVPRPVSHRYTLAAPAEARDDAYAPVQHVCVSAIDCVLLRLHASPVITLMLAAGKAKTASFTVYETQPVRQGYCKGCIDDAQAKFDALPWTALKGVPVPS